MPSLQGKYTRRAFIRLSSFMGSGALISACQPNLPSATPEVILETRLPTTTILPLPTASQTPPPTPTSLPSTATPDPWIEKQLILGEPPLIASTKSGLFQSIFGSGVDISFPARYHLDIAIKHTEGVNSSSGIVFATHEKRVDSPNVNCFVLLFTEGKWVISFSANGGGQFDFWEPQDELLDPTQHFEITFTQGGAHVQVENSNGFNKAYDLPVRTEDTTNWLGGIVQAMPGDEVTLSHLSLAQPKGAIIDPLAAYQPSMAEFALKDNFWLGGGPIWGAEAFHPVQVKILEDAFNVLVINVDVPNDLLPTGELDPAMYIRWEAYLNLAKARGLKAVHVANLIQMSVPDWLKTSNVSRDQAISIMEKYIQNMVGFIGQNAGDMQIWVSVVDEALDRYSSNGYLKEHFWYQKIGKDYLRIAYETSHKAAPQVMLLHNEIFHNAWEPGRPPFYDTDLIFKLVDSLRNDTGLDIQPGVQLYMEANNPPIPADLQKQFEWLGKLSGNVYITESHCNLKKLPVSLSQEEKLARQAEIYRQVFDVCHDSKVVRSLTMWGLSDFGLLDSGDPTLEAPYWFDEEYQPKPAFDAVYQVLRDWK